jgi:chemosensory pili system protein ChpE
MLELFIAAAGLGLLFNATPGAIFTESLRRGLKGGYRAALDVQIGSLVGDFVWAVLGLLGAAALFKIAYIETPLAVAGAVLLGWLAWQTLMTASVPCRSSIQMTARPQDVRRWLSGRQCPCPTR